MIFLFSKDMFTSVHFHIFPGLLDLWIILLFFQRILSIEYYKINACLFFFLSVKNTRTFVKIKMSLSRLIFI